MKKSIVIGCLALLAVSCIVVLVGLNVHAVDPHIASLVKQVQPYMAMAVVTKYGTAARDPAALIGIDAIYAQAEKRAVVSTISIANGDSINSTYRVGQFPSNAIIDPKSVYYYSAITGVSDIDFGFAYQADGALIDIDNLVDGDDVTVAGSQTLFGHGTLTAANSQKRVWELAGLTSDPGGKIDLLATLKAAATAAGTIQFFIEYYKAA